MPTEPRYFAWQGEVYECEVLHYLEKEGAWYAVVRPGPTQHKWLPTAEKENGFVAIPSQVVRRTRQEAACDISLAALRRFAQR